MRRTLTAVAIAALFISGGSAVASPNKPAHCKVLSVRTVQQTMPAGEVTGIVDGKPVFSHVAQHRTATFTTERCRGKVTTAVTYTPWS